MTDEDLENEVRKAKLMIEFIAKLTNEPSAKFKWATIRLYDKMSDVALQMNVIPESKFAELFNIVEQFDKVFCDFCNENNIKIKEE